MRRFLPRLVLYLLALTTGAALISFVIPILAVRVWGPYLPWSQSLDHMISFGHYCFVRAWLLWIAGALASIPMFWVHSARGLTLGLMSLSALVPVAYAVTYMLILMI